MLARLIIALNTTISFGLIYMFCVMLVGVPAVLSASTASVLFTLKYVDKYVFQDKK